MAPPKRTKTAVTALLLTAALASCGEDHGLQTVRGKVLSKGQPASGATLFFHREADAPPTPGAKPAPVPEGLVDEEGNFTLDSGEWGRGALPGKYKVLVIWPEPDSYQNLNAAAKAKLEKKVGRDAARRPADRLKGRYSKAEKPLLSAEVKAGTNDLPPFELTD